jgi:Flp pilus assembly CpaE family ATPase
MHKPLFVLLIHEVSTDTEPIRQALSEPEGFHLQCATRLTFALARIGGGGVDLILVDLSSSERTESEKLESVVKLRAAASHLPIVVLGGVLSDSTNDAVANLTAHGASAFLTIEQCKTDLRALVQRLTGDRGVAGIQQAIGVTSIQQAIEPQKTGAIMAVLGSKGGVGATTIALNLACVLAQNQRVILAELRPSRGSLSQYFKLHNAVRDLTFLLATEPDSILPSEMEACLWRSRNMPGLGILFGPQGTDHYLPIASAHAKAILKGLTALSDQVVIDLPSLPSDANRAVLQASECLALVVERDPISLESARLMLQTITSWGSAPQSMGTIIVNRAPVVAPVPIAEFEQRLGIPVFGVIPPGADECIAAQRANRPLVAIGGDSIVAKSLVALAKVLAQTTEPLAFDQKVATFK